MQATSKKLNSNTIEVTIKESATEMEHFKKSVARKIAGVRQFPGFRKNDEVPLDVIVREIGEDRLMAEMLEEAMQSLYPKAIKKLDIHPLDAGEITNVVSLSPLEVVVSVEILPEVTLDMKKIEKIHIELPQVSVTDEELQEELDEIIKKQTHFHPRGAHHEHDTTDAALDVTIHEGDKVTINAKGYDKKGGTSDSRMTLQNFDIVIGSKMLIPGFEEALIGAKIGDIVEFDVVFPPDYHSADFAGKNAFFSCEILDVASAHVPEWDAAFIEQVWGKPLALSDFRAEFREAMLQDRREKARSEAEEKLSSELIAAVELEVGPRMIARETDNLWQAHNREIERQGMDVKHYLEHLKTSEDAFKKEHIEPSALRRVKSMLILDALKAHYKPDVTDEEVIAETRKIFAQYAQNEEFEKRILEMAKPGTEHFLEIKSRLEFRAVIDRFLADSKSVTSEETEEKPSPKKKKK